MTTMPLHDARPQPGTAGGRRPGQGACLRRLGRAVPLLLGLLVAACATVPATDPSPLFADALFERPAQLPDASQLFALDAPMRHHLDARRRAAGPRDGPEQILLAALFDAGQLRLEYDSSLTRTASEAFAARAGNCLSLVVMTAAFAKELGLRVDYRTAVFDEIWSRQGDLRLRSGHVNLALGPRPIDRRPGMPDPPRVIDFYPPAQVQGLRMRPVREATVVAMYMNNRAAEVLADGSPAQAYWWAREAVRTDPGFAGALNTLGVVYLRAGALGEAERALRQALAVAPRHVPALGNLAQVSERQGRADEAAVLRRRLAEIDPHPAFAEYDRAIEAADRGQWALARELFERELDHHAYDAEIHHWLARAYAQLDDLPRAREHLAVAAEIASTPQARARFAAKLAGLQATRTH
jgi:tetratricopeptide (TPR) repeat protein